MTEVRPQFQPNAYAPGAAAAARDDAKLAMARAFFAKALDQAGAPKPASAPEPATAMSVSAQAAPAPAQSSQKLLRPGSLIDIRV